MRLACLLGVCRWFHFGPIEAGGWCRAWGFLGAWGVVAFSASSALMPARPAGMAAPETPCMSDSGGCFGRRCFGLVRLARRVGLTVLGVLCAFFVGRQCRRRALSEGLHECAPGAAAAGGREHLLDGIARAKPATVVGSDRETRGVLLAAFGVALEGDDLGQPGGKHFAEFVHRAVLGGEIEGWFMLR